MPQKFRQRGKKKKKSDFVARLQDQRLASTSHPKSAAHPASADAVPSSSVGFEAKNLSRNAASNEVASTAWYSETGKAAQDPTPFGLVSQELKTYLKNAYAQLMLMSKGQEDGVRSGRTDDEVGEEAEQISLLCLAILREVNGHELSCATDNESSVILEAVLDRIDTRRVRIFADRISGNFDVLASHRFGSHVLQSVLRSLQTDLKPANATVGKGKVKVSQPLGAEDGILRSSEKLILDFTDELVPHAKEKLQGTFSTHVLRTLLHVLAGHNVQSLGRSKKSLLFRSKVLTNDSGAENSLETKSGAGTFSAQCSSSTSAGSDALLQVYRIESFDQALAKLRASCLPEGIIGRNEARALLVSPSASPTFALLLSLEGQCKESARRGSLADVVLEGLISEIDVAESEPKDGVEALLRHTSGSHALEAILGHLPSRYVDRFWSVYIRGKICRIGCHPVANFVAATASRRLRSSTLEEALREILREGGGKLIKEGKTSVLLALVCRAAFCSRSSPLGVSLQELSRDACLSAFGLNNKDGCRDGQLIRLILALKTKDGWTKMMRRRAEKEANGTPEKQESNGASGKRKRGNDAPLPEFLRPEEVTVQGSVLLQALLRLDHPVNIVFYDSLVEIANPMPYVSHPIASHVYLVAINSPTASLQARRKLISRLTSCVVDLADDKYASRVADALWTRLDGYSREKLMRDTLSHRERDLVSSYYGRFFITKRCNMALWRKDFRTWKDWEVAQRAQVASSSGDYGEFSIADLGSEADDGLQVEDCVVATDGDANGEPQPEESRKERKKQKNENKQKRGRSSKEDQELDQILSGL